jgi:hypothetical protein
LDRRVELACRRRLRKPRLLDYQRDEALKRLEAGEGCQSIGKTMGVHHATIARLGA